MNLEIGPIFRSLMKNKIGSILIACQIAITMTIIANGFFIIKQRSEFMAREPGIDIPNSFTLTNFSYAENFNMRDSIQQDLDYIRSHPSVTDATTINAIPLSNGGWSMSLKTSVDENADSINTAVYMTDEHGLNSLDVELIAGENFSSNEITVRNDDTLTWPNSTLITQQLAELLWPDIPVEQTVGKTVYIDNDQPMLVKGVIKTLQAPWIGWGQTYNSMISPERVEFFSVRYYVRVRNGELTRTLQDIEQHLQRSQPGRMINDVQIIQSVYDNSYQQDAGMITILTSIMIILTFITTLGIVGLATFSVNRRKKQIGTRRALGATRSAIVRYFIIENFMISSIGIVLGAILSIGTNMALVNFFGSDTIDWYYIPLSMLGLWLVGLVAISGPATKASMIPPAIATRST